VDAVREALRRPREGEADDHSRERGEHGQNDGTPQEHRLWVTPTAAALADQPN
jgi:hypothetical protein